MKEIRRNNESGGDDNGDEHSAESHAPNLWRMRSNVKWGNYALMAKIDLSYLAKRRESVVERMKPL